MYETFLKYLPQSELVIMSGLPLPGRTVFWKDTAAINQFLAAFARSDPRLHYMEAADVMTSAQGPENLNMGNGRYFNASFFRMDQIHLNKAGHDVWTARIKETLRELGILP